MIIGCAKLHGGPFLKFETGYGLYYFEETDIVNPSAWGTIEETGERYPIPDDDLKCSYIEGINAADFFDCEFESLTPQEVESSEGMYLFETGQSAFSTALMYYSTFHYYDDSANESSELPIGYKIFTVEYAEDGIITPDSKITITHSRSNTDSVTTQN